MTIKLILVAFLYMIMGFITLEYMLYHDRKVDYIDRWIDGDFDQVMVVTFWILIVPRLLMRALYIYFKSIIKEIRVFYTTIIFLIAASIHKEKEEEKPAAQQENDEGKILSKLDIAKEVIRDHWMLARLGIYNGPNNSGAPVYMIYHDHEMEIYICYCYEYFEVYGLTDDEFADLKKYYDELVED